MKLKALVVAAALLAPLSAFAQTYSAETEVVLNVPSFCYFDAADLAEATFETATVEGSLFGKSGNSYGLRAACSPGVAYAITISNSVDGSLILRDNTLNREVVARIYQYDTFKGSPITNTDGITRIGTGVVQDYDFMVTFNEGVGKRPAVGVYEGDIYWVMDF